MAAPKVYPAMRIIEALDSRQLTLSQIQDHLGVHQLELVYSEAHSSEIVEELEKALLLPKLMLEGELLSPMTGGRKFIEEYQRKFLTVELEATARYARMKPLPEKSLALAHLVDAYLTRTRKAFQEAARIDRDVMQCYAGAELEAYVDGLLEKAGCKVSFTQLKAAALLKGHPGDVMGLFAQAMEVYFLLRLIGYFQPKTLKYGHLIHGWEAAHAAFATKADIYLVGNQAEAARARYVFYALGVTTRVEPLPASLSCPRQA